MTLSVEIAAQETTRWQHPEDPDVWIEGGPLGTAQRRAALKAANVSIETKADGYIAFKPWQLGDIALENAVRCFRAWGGIEDGGGNPAPCDRKHIRKLIDIHGPAVVQPAIEHFIAEFEELRTAREQAEKN